MSEGIKLVMSQIFGVPVESIEQTTSTETVERWDSMRHMQLVLALEDELGITFPDEVVTTLVSYRAIEEAVAALTD